MSNGLKPWAYGPFELLLHAELHLRNGDDFDRRIALISFDNAIEVAITTYLSLHPIQRQNRTYPRADVEQWLENYHTKIDFFMSEIQGRVLPAECEKADIVWYHDVRNGQYHGGSATIPQERELQGIRKAALWIFSVLYDVPDIEEVIENHITDADDHPKRNERHDRLIDQQFGVIEIAGQKYYTSEALHAVDPFAYGDVAAELDQPGEADDADAEGGAAE